MSNVTKRQDSEIFSKKVLTKRGCCGRISELPRRAAARYRLLTGKRKQGFSEKNSEKVLKNLLTSANESDIIDRLSQRERIET